MSGVRDMASAKLSGWSLGERILYGVLTAAARFMGAVPPVCSQRLGAWIGRCLWPFAASRRAIARANLDKVYGERL